MKLVATCDFYFGLRDREEVLRAGDEFTPPGTGVMNVAEHAKSLIGQGCALPPGIALMRVHVENTAGGLR
jgi:hypothetical protein